MSADVKKYKVPVSIEVIVHVEVEGSLDHGQHHELGDAAAQEALLAWMDIPREIVEVYPFTSDAEEA